MDQALLEGTGRARAADLDRNGPVLPQLGGKVDDVEEIGDIVRGDEGVLRVDVQPLVHGLERQVRRRRRVAQPEAHDRVSEAGPARSRRDLDIPLENGKLLAGRVPQEDGQMGLPLDDGERIRDADAHALGRLQPVRRDRQRQLLVVLEDDLVAPAEADVDLEIAVVLVLGLVVIDRQLLGGEGEIEERQAGHRIPDDRHLGVHLDDSWSGIPC